MQRIPVATPHVGHETDNNCVFVSCFTFTLTECHATIIASKMSNFGHYFRRGSDSTANFVFFKLLDARHLLKLRPSPQTIVE